MPDFLAVGHVTRDLVCGEHRTGGAAAYAALTAHRLGLHAAVVTSASSDWEGRALLAGVDLHLVPSTTTTVFENRYHRGRRSQFLKSVAQPIRADDVPQEWRRTPVVLLAPVAREVHAEVAHGFSGSLVGAVLQGWLRRWDAQGRVSRVPWDPREMAPYLAAAVLSQEEVSPGAWLPRLVASVPHVVVTHGARGSTLYLRGKPHAIRGFPRPEVDPTGAGDVYAAAFLVRCWESGDPLAAARFASCAASYCVEAPGVEGVPTREQVESRLRGSGQEWPPPPLRGESN